MYFSSTLFFNRIYFQSQKSSSHIMKLKTDARNQGQISRVDLWCQFLAISCDLVL